MDNLFDALEDYMANELLLPAVRMAAKRGRTVMSKYYGLTDESVIYRIAMSSLHFSTPCTLPNVFIVLHPAYKVSYFRKRKWPQEWIDEALNALRDEWRRNYKPDAAADVCLTSQTNSSAQVSFHTRYLYERSAHALLVDIIRRKVFRINNTSQR
jgi:hypothetical protein